MKFTNLAGWAGVGLILTAYSLSSFGVLAPVTRMFGILNMLGATGIIISSYPKRDFQPVVLNVVWLVVAIIGIIRSIH